jgi:phosphate starvation-inducible protein PhoH and related proteins
MASSGKKARKQQLYREMGDTANQYKTQPKSFPKLQAQSYVQQDYIDAIHDKDIVFALGSAGSGKSYVATHYAAEQLFYRRIDKIILTRPAVEAAGEELGFLPGELVEGKLMPYLTPYMETFNELLGKSFVEYCLKTGVIEPVPLAYMRGRSFGSLNNGCLILADEMQSATPMQMKLLLTRIGDNTKMLINGDIEQRDKIDATGLEDAIARLQYLDEVEVIKFTDDDCVRSGICKKVLKAYRN